MSKKDVVILYSDMALYMLNRFVLTHLSTHGILYEIIHWHLNDYLGEIVFLWRYIFIENWQKQKLLSV